MPFPCPLGTFGHSPGLRELTDCVSCWGGRYCSQTGLAEPDGLCDEGYYCSSGAFTAAPIDGVTGGLCPAGGYCPQGSKIPTNCPAGTYNPAAGQAAASDCQACPAGSYCAGSSNPAPTGPCQAGYYCPAGAVFRTQVAAAAGRYTAEGAWEELLCAAGTYNPYPAQPSCLTCEAGRLCSTTGRTSQADCGAGYWCGAGALAANACPVGTNSSATRAVSLDACAACAAGWYCDAEALTAAAGQCSAGSFCLRGATKASFTLAETTADYGICPLHHYCPAGTGQPPHCGDGRWSAGQTGLTDAAECSDCPAGSYCHSSSATQPTGDCAEGYYCPAGSSVAAPAATPCTAGHFCPAGSPSQSPCPAGSYQPLGLQGSCTPCSAGSYCPAGASAQLDCPDGHYCPEATGSGTANPCPLGTYNDLTKRTAAIDCRPCDPGSHCSGTGLTAVSGTCSAGYYCTVGSPSAQPGATAPTGYQTIFPITSYGGKCPAGTYCPAGTPTAIPCRVGHVCPTEGMDETGMAANPCPAGRVCEAGLSAAGPLCPAGHYCPAGSSAGTPCPAGTYLATEGAQAVTDCLDCPGGQYCGSPGLSSPTGTCSAGYLCTGRNVVATPPAGLCPKGFKCPAGATTAVACSQDPEYQDEAGQDVCKTCPASYWCDDSTITRCQPGTVRASFYCPATTRARVACPAGTINYVDGSAAASDCTPCPAGSYCAASDATDTTGTGSDKTVACPAGSYCLSGAAAAVACPAGYYCPAGSGRPVPCDAGSYCATTGLSEPTGPCSAGSWCSHSTVTYTGSSPTDWTTTDPPRPYCVDQATCVTGATSATQTTCPAGAYCPAGSHTPTECPIGTTNANTGSTDAAACTACAAGSKCPRRGMSAPGPACQAGYYCPAGSATDTEHGCPAGSKCPAGQATHTPCQPGTYQPYELASGCETCPAGWYCPTTGATAPRLCPAGHFCPAGTAVDVTLRSSGALTYP